MTLQQQQEQGEGHRCNEMMPKEYQQQIEASSEHNSGVERSSLYPFRLGWLDVDNMKADDV